MATFEASLLIPRPLAATFDFVTDFRNAPRWDPRTYEAHKLTPGRIGLGTRFRLLGGLISRNTLERLHIPELLRQHSELDYEVVSFVPRGEMVVRGETHTLVYEDHLVFTPEGDATRLHYLATLKLRSILALGDFVLGPIFDAIGADATGGIPAAVEAAVPAAGAAAAAPPLVLPANPILGIDDVHRTVALDAHPVLRNLLITQGYHDLSNALLARTGGADMNWCTLGSWASKTAGTFIRDEEIPTVFRKLLEAPHDLQPALADIHHKLSRGDHAEPREPRVLAIARAVLHDCSTYIKVGNQVVYAELARCCADFLRTLGSDQTPDPARLAAFQDQYIEGDPLPDAVDWGPDRTLRPRPRGGQSLLRGMVRHLYDAMFETDPKQRAEHILFANALGGLHEQTRLQTYIAGGIDAPITDTIVAWAHKHVDRHIPDGERGFLHHAIDATLAALARHIEQAWQVFSTDTLMTLTLPDAVLHLGEHLPPGSGTSFFPPSLETIADPELAAFLDRFGALHVRLDHSVFSWLKARVRDLFSAQPMPNGLAEVGAINWTNLDQRMRFILTLFRARQQDRGLFQPPFTDEQRAAMFEGRIPFGRL